MPPGEMSDWKINRLLTVSQAQEMRKNGSTAVQVGTIFQNKSQKDQRGWRCSSTIGHFPVVRINGHDKSTGESE